MSRTLTVQSVLYGNDPMAIVSAAVATANAAKIARSAGDIASWTLALGDCSEVGILEDVHLSEIEKAVEAASGELVHTVFGENLGHGGGHNRLAPLTQSDLILILNPDAMLAPNTLLRLASAVTDEVGAVDARQLPLEHPKYYDPITGDQSWASGACLMTPRSVFDAVGGFDHETFFMYCDDVDYSWRVKLAGYRVVHQPSARVFHDKRLTVDADIVPSAAEVYFSAEAAVLLAYKYSRPEIASAILTSFRKSPDETYLRVVDEVESRVSEGRLSPALDSERLVAQFVNGNYAQHRY